MTIVSLNSTAPADAPALVEQGGSTTYGELRELRDQTRAGIVASGLEPGDRVGIICTNTRSSVVAFFGIVSAGLIAVPLNPSSPTNELQRELEAVGAKMLLVGSEVDPALHDNIRSPAGVIVPGVEPLPEGPPAEPNHTGEHDIAVMLFTSGTAGLPKPAMLSHRNLTFVQEAIINHEGSGQNADAVTLCALPLSHIYGLNVALLTTLRAGGRIVLLERFDAAAVIEQIAAHGVTHFAGVPPMFRYILDLEGVPDDAFAGVQRIASGASPLSRQLFEEFEERFGITLSEGYGLTENSAVLTTHIGVPGRAGTVGRPLPGVEFRILDHDGNIAPPEDPGIITVRSEGIFQGYWNDEEATKAVLQDGWLNTGDIGVFSEDGYLMLVDRAKDLIIVAGFNVFPHEVEAVVNEHPAVGESVVVGRHDERRGERVVAYVTLNEGHTDLSLDDLVAYCRNDLARYKCPAELHIVDQLPIAPSGKRIRRELA